MSEATRPDADQDPLIGTRVCEFIVRRRLAAGGMGIVYYLEHSEIPTKRSVLKVLLPAFARNPQIRERFKREAANASRLDHDAILSIENYGVLPDGQLFMIVPFLRGRPLDEHLARNGGKLPLHDGLHIGFQLSAALDHAHRQGVIHRDLKPANVFVTPSDEDSLRIKLLDFGISKSVGPEVTRQTHSGMSIGTPMYMPCEQYDRPGDATLRADIFALAVMMTELLTGTFPWGVNDPGVLYFLQRTQPPACPPGMPIELFENVIAPSLSFAPNRRASSAHAFAAALARYTRERSPSGKTATEMLRAVCPRFVDTAPSDDTLPDAHAPAAAPLPVASSIPSGAPSDARATTNERNKVRPSPTSPPSVRDDLPMNSKSGGWKVAVAGLGATAFAGLVTFAIASSRRTSASVAALPTPAQSSPISSTSPPADASTAPGKTSEGGASVPIQRVANVETNVGSGSTHADRKSIATNAPPGIEIGDQNTGFDLYVSPGSVTQWRLDGETRTDRLPSRIRGIRPGVHTVAIDAPPGFIGGSQQVSVAAGKAGKLEIVLQPSATASTVTKRSTLAARPRPNATESASTMKHDDAAAEVGQTARGDIQVRVDEERGAKPATAKPDTGTPRPSDAQVGSAHPHKKFDPNAPAGEN